ncbi:hypothetical protein PVAND_013422 [Polypedilum vanderplanki]|uniref:BHLH domain-containing protein n=1 Tax=Polypedilum vanderplanki TaxID=319348 RepID=A0A9J6CRC8_POLVA|nr:hypothetical protein PVAND_013422 [Polypedilum vanderplanki]
MLRIIIIIVAVATSRGSDVELFGNEMEMSMKQRNQANARERYRTHSVNSAFNTLRLLIPTEPKIENCQKSKLYAWQNLTFLILNATLSIGNSTCRQPCFEVSSNKTFQHDYRSKSVHICVSSVISS